MSNDIDIYAILQEKQANWVKTTEHLLEVMSEHDDLIKKILTGKTPYRSLKHFHYVLNSNLPIKFLPEEENYKKDMDYVLEIRDSYLEC